MTIDECVVIEVKPSNVKIDTYECPMCGSDITKKNMKPCKKNIDGHSICRQCYLQLASKYYEGGDGCLYCGDPKTKREPVREISRIDLTQIQRTTEEEARDAAERLSGSMRGLAGHNNTRERFRPRSSRIFCLDDNFCAIFCLGFWVSFCIVACIATAFVMCNIFYFIGTGLIHWANGEDHTSHGTDMTLTRAVYGFCGLLVIAYIVLQIYLLFDICSRKFCFEPYIWCLNKISDTPLCNWLYYCITCENCSSPTREDERSRTVVVPIE